VDSVTQKFWKLWKCLAFHETNPKISKTPTLFIMYRFRFKKIPYLFYHLWLLLQTSNNIYLNSLVTVSTVLHDGEKTQFDSQTMYSRLQKKTGNENFPNVNLVLSICQLIVSGEISFIVSAKTSTSSQFKILKKFRNDCVSLLNSVKISKFLIKQVMILF
jgi:hypothetical protein